MDRLAAERVHCKVQPRLHGVLLLHSRPHPMAMFSDNLLVGTTLRASLQPSTRFSCTISATFTSRQPRCALAHVATAPVALTPAKGVFFSGADSPSSPSAVASARACLWLCLDQYPTPHIVASRGLKPHLCMYFYEFKNSCRSLKLMHPLMPFVSEELWNRLPHLAGEAPSLMIASYAPATFSFPRFF